LVWFSFLVQGGAESFSFHLSPFRVPLDWSPPVWRLPQNVPFFCLPLTVSLLGSIDPLLPAHFFSQIFWSGTCFPFLDSLLRPCSPSPVSFGIFMEAGPPETFYPTFFFPPLVGKNAPDVAQVFFFLPSRWSLVPLPPLVCSFFFGVHLVWFPNPFFLLRKASPERSTPQTLFFSQGVLAGSRDWSCLSRKPRSYSFFMG